LSSATRVQVTNGDQCAAIIVHRALRGRLRLSATNAVTGERINSVKAAFRLSGSSSWSGSAEDGEIAVPPLTNFELQLGAKGYELAAVQQVASLQRGETRDISVAFRPIQLGCVTGTVVDLQGAPVSSVRVQLSQASENLRFDPPVQPTEGNGSFKFDGV